MDVFRKIGPGGLLLTAALIACIVAVSLGFFVQLPTSPTQEWRGSCWISPCVANRTLSFFWERYYPYGHSSVEAVGVGGNGTIVVVDRGGMVHVLTPPRFDPRPVELPLLFDPPEAVAVGANGTIAVVDRRGMVHVLTPPRFDPRPVELPLSFGPPEAVAVGANGTIAVVDREGMVHVLTPPRFDPRSVELPRPFGPPEAVAVGANGTIAVVDREGMVQVLTRPDSDPRPVENLPLLGTPEAVAVGTDGTIGVVDRDGVVYVSEFPYSDPSSISTFRVSGPPVAIAVNADGITAVFDGEGMVYVVESPYSNPRPVENLPPLDPPGAVAVGANGTIAVVDSEGMVYVVESPYSNPRPVENLRLVGPPGAVAVAANRTIVVADSQPMVLASSPPYTAASALFGPLRPAHWSWFAGGLALINLVLLLRMLLRRDSTNNDREDLPDIESDKPIDDPRKATKDSVTLARRIARLLRHLDASVPFTIALTGKWGSGKSSLMKLVHNELVPDKPSTDRYPCVWFNAWHHQNEEFLFASLMESIRSSLLSEFPISGYISFHLRLLILRIKQVGSIMFLATVLAGATAIFVMLYNIERTDLTMAKTYLMLLIPSIPPTLLATTRWNPMKAFRVSPASLIRSSARWIKFPRFRDRLSFRHQFGQSFGQVCDAFRGRRLIIIIDDLDRCRPEQVVKILEAVSFLTSNGDCFVLLGLDEDQVTHAIGLHHRSIAKEIYRTSNLSGYESRQRYAEHYLEKLVNLRMSVPLPGRDDIMIKRRHDRV